MQVLRLEQLLVQGAQLFVLLAQLFVLLAQLFVLFAQLFVLHVLDRVHALFWCGARGYIADLSSSHKMSK